MGLCTVITNLFNSFSTGPSLDVRFDVNRRQILASNNGPRAERVNSSPSRCIKASFRIFEEWPNFLKPAGFLEQKFSWNCFKNNSICFHLSPTSSHFHPLQVENCGSNSRLVVDEDDNGKFRLERVDTVLICETSTII